MTIDELTMQIRQMGYMLELKNSTMVPIINKIREMQAGLLQLHKERDEARREACFRENELRGYSVLPMSAQDYAKELGWDCFKKETPWSMINFMRDECGHEFDVIRDNLWFKELSTIHELKMKETP